MWYYLQILVRLSTSDKSLFGSGKAFVQSGLGGRTGNGQIEVLLGQG